MSSDAVGWITSLDVSERRLLGAFRSAAFALQRSGGELDREAETQIAVALGTSPHEPVPPCFRAVMLTLGHHARRDLRFHLPACACLGADEALFVRLHAQLAAGAASEARALAHRLVDDEAVAALLHHGAALAALRSPAGTAPPPTTSAPAAHTPPPGRRAGNPLH